MDVITAADPHGGGAAGKIAGKGQFVQGIVSFDEGHRQPGSTRDLGVVTGLGGGRPGAVGGEDRGKMERLRGLDPAQLLAPRRLAHHRPLGALGAGDIGSHFPPSDPQWKGASSDRFLAHAVELAGDAGYVIGNVDVTIVCEAPKIGPHRAAMRERLAGILEVPVGAVSVKATTTERLGSTGRGEGIAAQAVATLLLR